MRSIIENLKKTVEISISEEERQKLWLEMLDHYNNLIALMRKKGTNYAEQELKNIKKKPTVFIKSGSN